MTLHTIKKIREVTSLTELETLPIDQIIETSIVFALDQKLVWGGVGDNKYNFTGVNNGHEYRIQTDAAGLIFYRGLVDFVPGRTLDSRSEVSR